MNKTGIKLIIAMKKQILILCLMVIACGVGFAGDNDSLYLKKNAFEESVYFIQTSALQNTQQQNNEILNCAARQIAMRSSVVARYIITADGKNPSGTRTSVELNFDQNGTINLIDQLKIVEIKKKGSEIQALVQYTGKKAPKNCDLTINTKIGKRGNPSWVDLIPTGSKFFASVGFVDSSRLPDGGFTGSDSMAIGSLAEYLVKPVVSENTKTFETIISGAYIARRWYNINENRYYSLAVIPRK